jgi:hypothetical protein
VLERMPAEAPERAALTELHAEAARAVRDRPPAGGGGGVPEAS